VGCQRLAGEISPRQLPLSPAFLIKPTLSAPPDQVLTFLAVLGSTVAWIYSAPPLKLKANGWTGTYALGSSYIALPWWCGSRQGGVGQRWGQASLSGPGLVACT
jgi:4-hydroxybenzoate polyprenyltransferase